VNKDFESLLIAIKDYCKKQPDCTSCTFKESNGFCFLDDTPADWDEETIYDISKKLERE